MIPVRPAEEPSNFDADVRRPGLRAIAERVGEVPPRAAGQRYKQVADSREEIPAAAFPAYWSRALDDLMERYDRICSYSSLYIHPVTGARSVDHMVAKSMRWDQVYEWTNYRLACSLMNARKDAIASVLDPFETEDGWFALELVGFQVVAGAGLAGDDLAAVEDTIQRLRLNDLICCEARAEYAEDYWDRQVRFDYLTRRAPFVARELQRQGRLHEEDRG